MDAINIVDVSANVKKNLNENGSLYLFRHNGGGDYPLGVLMSRMEIG